MIQLYEHPLSGHAHRARAMLKLLKLDYESITVDMTNNAHKSEEFLKLNPLGQVPVLVDGEDTIRDSAGILTYLALKYDPNRRWLPANPRHAAEVSSWLTTSTKEIFEGPFKARLVKILNFPFDYSVALEKSDEVLGGIFDPHLAKNDWLVGSGPTIADIANYSYIASAPEGGVDLSPYPNVIVWLRRLEKLEGFDPMPRAADILAV